MCVDQRELQTARDEADYYRSEAERLGELGRDRSDQLRRKANDEMRRRQPSNRLYNGDVTDFSDAIACHISACQQEIETPRRCEVGRVAVTKSSNNALQYNRHPPLQDRQRVIRQIDLQQSPVTQIQILMTEIKRSDTQR